MDVGWQHLAQCSCSAVGASSAGWRQRQGSAGVCPPVSVSTTQPSGNSSVPLLGLCVRLKENTLVTCVILAYCTSTVLPRSAYRHTALATHQAMLNLHPRPPSTFTCQTPCYGWRSHPLKHSPAAAETQPNACNALPEVDQPLTTDCITHLPRSAAALPAGAGAGCPHHHHLGCLLGRLLSGCWAPPATPPLLRRAAPLWCC